MPADIHSTPCSDPSRLIHRYRSDKQYHDVKEILDKQTVDGKVYWLCAWAKTYMETDQDGNEHRRHWPASWQPTINV